MQLEVIVHVGIDGLAMSELIGGMISSRLLCCERY